MNMSVESHKSRKGNKNYGVLERDMQVHLVLYWRSNVMFTLMKIFLKVDWPSVNEVKAGVKGKEVNKKNVTKMNLQFGWLRFWSLIAITNKLKRSTSCVARYSLFSTLVGSCEVLVRKCLKIKTLYSIYWGCSFHMIGGFSSSVYPVTWQSILNLFIA